MPATSSAASPAHAGNFEGPIERFQFWLVDNNLIHEAEIRRIETEADAEIEAAVAFADSGTLEPIEELERFVTMDRVPA